MKLFLASLAITAVASAPVIAPTTGAAGNDPDNKGACYRNLAFGEHQRSNFNACKQVCDATGEAEACAVVAMDALTCPEGFARKNGESQPCEPCTTDAEFAKYNGCGVECTKLKCEHKQHTCPNLGLYADMTDENTRITAINHDQRPFYRAKSMPWAPVAPTPVSSCAQTKSMHVTHPKTSSTHWTPGTREHLEVMCVRGHVCRNEAGGQCFCRPNNMPFNYVSPAIVDGNWGSWTAAATCEGAKRRYTRQCNNPAPFWGAPCDGDATELRTDSTCCSPSFTANCFTKNDGSVTNCAGTTWFNEVTQNCEACPAYATCKNGVVVMQTVRTTAYRNKFDQRTFHIPEQMKYDRCKISVQARQTDYGNAGTNYASWNEHLIIRHHDVDVKLHNNCGFKHQCYNDLYTCNIDSDQEMVTIDHGPDDHITIQGENGNGVDYCPFNPTQDLSGNVDFANGFYGTEHVADSSQTSGACGKYEQSSNCYHMWAQVSIDCCCKGASCTC